MHHKLEQRFFIYTPLAMLCGLAGVWLGIAAAVWSFIQVVAVIELTYWFGASAADFSGGVSPK